VLSDYEKTRLQRRLSQVRRDIDALECRLYTSDGLGDSYGVQGIKAPANKSVNVDIFNNKNGVIVNVKFLLCRKTSKRGYGA